MELLIPGLILVALMMYASTRIKKSAAKAFEAESVESEEFIIEKADGFLRVIGGDPRYAFEAYSKGYGGDGAEEFRQATATLTISPATAPAAAVINGGEEIVSERTEVIGGIHYRIKETRRTIKGVEFYAISKIAEQNSKVYLFETMALIETTGEMMSTIEAMVNSFELKSGI